MVQRVCRKRLPIYLILGMLLSACMDPACGFEEPSIVSGELEKFVDKSLLTGEPCAPPCWQGITPGTTSATEAAEILKGLEFTNPDSVSLARNSQGGLITWNTIFAKDETNYIDFDGNGIVDAINIYDLWYRITLQELIDAIRDPDGVMTCLVPAPADSPKIYPDCRTVDVVWLDEGLTVTVAEVPTSEENPSRVQPNLVISRVSYFPSVSGSREYIADHECMDSNFVTWEGFGE